MPKIRLRSRHWLEDGTGKMFMGEGRMEILQGVERTGSMNRTAKELGMSYRGVWGRIKSMESRLNAKIVDTDTRRGSVLTEAGRRLLERYEKMKKACVEADDLVFQKYFPNQDERDLEAD